MPRAWLLVVVLTACSGPMDRKQLHGAVSELHAFAAESELLFELRDAGEAPRAYARGQRSALLEHVTKTLDDLDAGISDARLAAPWTKARVLGGMLATTLRGSESEAQLAEVRHELMALDVELEP